MTTVTASKKIGDLVDLRPIQTIIQLGDQEGTKEAVESFVLTDELQHILNDFSQRAPKESGSGVFLKGHYGTGKSHLLSFLSKDAETGFGHLSQLLETAALPSFHTLSISLVQHPSSKSLEDIVRDTAPNGDSQQERSEFHLGLFQKAKAAGHHGLIILLDELSEFLKAKPSPESLTEDLRYLQYLGELTSTSPLWLIGAIQEDLEGMGAATRETSLKLKDRFSLRWNLSQLHLEQMLNQRLLKLKDGAPDFLARLHQRCQALWPGVFRRDGQLLSIYPLHPLTLDLLTHLGTLFSEHRGALRFVRDMLKGTDSTAPHLQREAHALLGPELLFDYFSNRFEENLELQHYHRKAWVHLSQRVQERLQPEDHELAFRALKVILLCSIDPRQEGITLPRLGEALMLQRDRDVLKGQLELKEEVLDPLLERCNYLKLTDERYHIDLSHEGQSLLDELLSKRISNLPPLEDGGWLRLLTLLNQNPLRLAPLIQQIKPTIEVQWLNSTRQLRIGLGEKEQACDLQILLPGQLAQARDESILIWEPSTPEDPTYWIEAVALMELVEAPAETAMEARAKEQALKRYRLERPRWVEKLEDLYIEGQQFVGREPLRLQLSLARRLSLEAFLEPLAHEIFSRKHPHFRTIAPKISYYSEQSYAQLIEHLFRPGAIKEGEANRLHLGDALHGIALPMGLAEKKGSQYVSLWDPARSELINTFEKILVSLDLKEVKAHLLNGPWGIPTGQMNFLIWSGVAMGHLIAYREGDELPFEKLSLYNLESIDSLKKREALDESTLHQLTLHPFFNHPGLTYSGLTLQRKLWERVLQQINVAQSLTEKVDLAGGDFWTHHASSREKALELLLKVHHTIQGFGNDSHAGLEWFVEHFELMNEWIEASLWLKEFNRLDKNHGKDLEQLIVFMLDESLDELGIDGDAGDLKKVRHELLQSWRGSSPSGLALQLIASWMKDGDQWCHDYRKAYKISHAHHQEQRPAALYTWLKELRQKGLSLPSMEPPCERNLEKELQFKAECRCGHRLKGGIDESPNWSEMIIEIMELRFSGQNNLSRLIAHCQDNAFDHAHELWRIMEQNVPKQRSKHIKELSLNQLIGKAQVMNREKILDEIKRHLPEDPEQFYRIED